MTVADMEEKVSYVGSTGLHYVGTSSYEKAVCANCHNECFIQRSKNRKANFCSRPCWYEFYHRSIDDGKNRYCNKCKTWKPYAEFYTFKATNGRNRTKYFWTCKVCHLEYIHSDEYRVLARKRMEEEKTQPRFIVDNRMSTAIYLALKSQKAGRGWEKLVGYTLDELMRHLEIRFSSGMTWGNMGDWHIDHKTPRSHFHYLTSSSRQFKKCWSLDNLQPLWAKDNREKSNKINWIKED